MKSISTLIIVCVIVSLSIKILALKGLNLSNRRYRGDDLGFE